MCNTDQMIPMLRSAPSTLDTFVIQTSQESLWSTLNVFIPQTRTGIDAHQGVKSLPLNCPDKLTVTSCLLRIISPSILSLIIVLLLLNSYFSLEIVNTLLANTFSCCCSSSLGLQEVKSTPSCLQLRKKQGKILSAHHYWFQPIHIAAPCTSLSEILGI